MKTRIDKLFLYKHRFVIGFSILALFFISILILLPYIAPGGISEAEMQSVVSSDNATLEAITSGDLVNLPYRLLQKISISIFGLSLYSIKLPSILLGFATGFLLILLLNRWFKTNVALLASAITIFSPIFLFLAGSGTPTILYIFWLVLTLWLGAKIVGEKKQSPFVFLALIVSLCLSLYTPHLAYIAIGIAIIGIARPHLRHTIKSFKLPQLIIGFSLALILIAPLIFAAFIRPAILQELFFASGSIDYFDNLSLAFAPFFSFSSNIESVYLSPLFGMATIALIVIGIIASMRSLFTSRNTAISLLVIFAILVAGVNPDIAVLIIIPVAILVATSIEYILGKWYSLFPTNPYARVIGIVPITIFIGIIVISGLVYTVFGYHYSPVVAKSFNNDITLINTHAAAGSVLLIPENTLEYNFYKILEDDKSITIMSALPDRTEGTIISLGKWHEPLELKLSTIITSSKSQNSDRLYIYNQTD